MPGILTVLRGIRVGERFSLPDEAVTILGRDTSADIQILDRGLSRKHVRFQPSEGTFIIEDIASANGTFLNGHDVKHATLRDGDVITVGETDLAFTIERQSSTGGSAAPVRVDLVGEEAPGTTKIRRRFTRADTEILKPETDSSQDPEKLRRAHAKLSLLYKVSSLINQEVELDHLFRTVIDTILELTGAERGFLVLTDKKTSGLQPVTARRAPNAKAPERAAISTTILRECIQNGISVLTHDAAQDERFRGGDSIVMGRIRSAMCVPVSVRGENLGALYVDSVSRRVPFSEDDLELLTTMGMDLGGALRRAKLMQDLESLFYGTVKALVAAIDAKDPYTHGHSERVCLYSVQVAEAMGIAGKELDNLKLAALFHDIGKIGVPERVLNKPGKLTPDEYELIKRHPTIGANMLRNIRNIDMIVHGVLYHHERIDGRGFPQGLSGDQIPIEARIIAVADSLDAMTSNRSYRRGLPMEAAVEEFKRNLGTQFDPGAAQVLLGLLERNELRLHASAEEDLFSPSKKPGTGTPPPSAADR